MCTATPGISPLPPRESAAPVDPRTELKNLLESRLPLDSVTPDLREAAHRAVRSGDVQRMRMIARRIIAELQSQGNGLNLPTAHPSVNRNRNPHVDQFLAAMEVAQNLQVGGPEAREVGTVLAATIRILERLAPSFRLSILLFENTELGDTHGRVFCLDSVIARPAWLDLRPIGQSAFIPGLDELPANITSGLTAENTQTVTVAVPLFAPLAGDQETGLLFVLAPDGWPRQDLLRTGAKLGHFITHRWRVHHELNQKIHVDALTGLYNRRFLDDQLPLLVERARRNGTSLAMIVADIDLFKSVNSKYDLLVGDQVLQMVARRLQEEVRQVDEVFRRGGEEFAIILPETDRQAAREVLTRLLSAPFVTVVQFAGQTIEVRVTLSQGVSIFPADAVTHGQLHSQAVNMMKKAKDLGRNRGYFWEEDEACFGSAAAR